jgi:parallel beta-helix repeat protein
MLCLAFVFFCNLSHAATYYFSTSSGDDSRSSSQAQNSATPWKTIKKLNSIFGSLRPGDKVLFKSGDTFYGSIHITRSGSSGSPIVIGSYGSGPKPVITSLVTLGNWKSIGNGIYESTDNSLTKGVNVVLMNEKIQELGRYPNSDASNGGYLTISSSSGNSSVSSNELSSSPNFSGGEIVIRKNQWIIDRHKISSHSGNRVNYSGTGSYSPSKGYGFFIQGHLQALDKLGEWHYNGTNKKLHVYFGSNNPNSNVIQASSLDYLITKTYGISNLRIENLHLNGSNKDAIHFAGGTNIQINNTEVENSGENGITMMSVLNLVINNSRVANSLNNGINLKYGNVGAKVSNNVIENSYIFQGTAQSGDNSGVGILVTSDNSIIEHNKVINTGYNGISFNGNGTQIKNNLIDKYSIYKNDGGGIYSFGGTGLLTVFKGRKIEGNIILNGQGTREGTPEASVLSKAHSSGIFLDDNSNGIEVINNTIANSVYAGIKIANGSNINVKNNTFYNSFHHVLLGNSGIRGRNTRDINVDNNIFFSKHSDQYAYTIRTDYDDISSMGSFNQNYFARPLGDNYSISVSYKKGGKKIDDILNLKRWQNIFNEDNNSKNLDKVLKAFEVKSLIGSNRYANGSFDKNINEMFCSECKSSWVSDKLEKGAMKVDSPGPSSLRFEVGAVKKDKNYILKFKGVSNKSGGLRVYFRYGGAPWEIVSPSTTVELNNKAEEYTILLKPYEDVDKTAVMLVSDEGNWTYWVDEVEFKEADVKIVDPSEKILFEYNPTKSEKTVALNGTYVDAKNKTYSGKITLAPYSSAVLVNTSGNTIDVPKEAPKVSITAPGNNSGILEGSSLSIKAEASATDAKITKVEFFNGSKLLGSTTSSPYSFTWKNVPLGTQTITAVATDGNNLQATSKEVQVKVTSKIVDENLDDDIDQSPGKDQGPGNDQVDFSPLYVNTGSDEPINFEGSSFMPLAKTNIVASQYTKSAHKAKSVNELFQSSSYAKDLKYSIPVPNGLYTVKTYHSEGYFGEAGPAAEAGQRVFDIVIEEEMMKDDFDMYTKSGNSEVILTFENVEVKDGLLNIEMMASANNAVISGVAVLPAKDESSDNLENAIFINAGSRTDVMFKGNRFVSDYTTRYFSKSDKNENLQKSPEPLYQSYRFADDLNYAVPVANGTYKVITYHFENYFGVDGPTAKKGQRVFDIIIENEVVKNDFDMFTEGNNGEVALTFEEIEVKDGVLNLKMSASSNNAVVSGIAIIPMQPSIAGRIQSPGTNALLINTGSPEDVEHEGSNFISEFAGEYFSKNSIAGENITASIDPLYQSYRYAPRLNYKIPVANGTYSVVTYHNETFFGKSKSAEGPNKRVFDILLEGKVVKDNLDMFVEYSNEPLALQFDNVIVKDGILNLDLVASMDNATISGIAIISESDKALLGEANLRIANGPSVESGPKEESDIALGTGGESIKLYPNPAKDIVTLSMNKEVGEFSILVHNMNGQQVDHHDARTLSTVNGEYSIPVHHLQKGVYLVTLAGEREIIKRLRLMVAP